MSTATIAVLAQQGVEVIVPESQGCCGGLAWHTGDLTAAQNFARKNLAAFPADVCRTAPPASAVIAAGAL